MIQEYLQIQSEQIEKQLEQLVPSQPGPYQDLIEAARYALLGGGKRLRPILALTTVKALGGCIKQALPAACTLELIHTYSMIHDDLPCMDDDDYRRGRLTVHRKYSEGHAVLTGDFLLTYAFEVLAADQNLHPEKKVKLISTLSRQSGGQGMIGGQVIDIASEKQEINLELLQLLHKNKTADLITASMEFGGILGNASENHVAFLRQFGENVGLAFQVVDDILDVTSSEIKHGRQTASDVLNGKATYVSLLGMEQAEKCAEEYYQKGIEALQNLSFDTTLLKEIAWYIIKRKH